MARICEVVQQVIMTGYLTVKAEDQLRRLLKAKYDSEDLNAFMMLQQAAMEGCVKQESRDLKGLTPRKKLHEVTNENFICPNKS